MPFTPDMRRKVDQIRDYLMAMADFGKRMDHRMKELKALLDVHA